MSEDVFIGNALFALCDLKGYDYEKVVAWLDENKDKGLNLVKNGIVIDTVEQTETTKEDGGETTITIDKVTTFKLDIKNGLKMEPGIS